MFQTCHGPIGLIRLHIESVKALAIAVMDNTLGNRIQYLRLATFFQQISVG